MHFKTYLLKCLTRILARTPEEVAEAAQAMEQIGIDMIGLMTGMTYEGVSAGEIHPQVKERVLALANSVKKTPTLADAVKRYLSLGE